mmetsp:Transcript_14197/g.46346  ORF Transcript_14197/g.46346 Transcript_14197/m.46346 type:complete len:521 (+) Transcript_14197:434-1996(+)
MPSFSTTTRTTKRAGDSGTASPSGLRTSSRCTSRPSRSAATATSRSTGRGGVSCWPCKGDDARFFRVRVGGSRREKKKKKTTTKPVVGAPPDRSRRTTKKTTTSERKNQTVAAADQPLLFFVPNPYGWLVDALANCFIEAQRVARHVVFHHVSKAAGTSFCKVARSNGCVGPKQFSTLWAAGDGPTWGNCARGGRAAHEHSETLGRGRRNRNCAARELSCEKRRSAFEKGGPYDVMAVERWLDRGGDLCSGLWYATLVREPVARTISHHNHLWRHTLRTKPRGASGRRSSYFAGGVFENETACVDLKAMPAAIGAPHRTGYDWSMVCALSSNFATRSILGTRFSRRPYDGAVPPRESSSETLRQMARRTLADFAVVIVVERADEAGPLLRQALGWRDSQGLPRAGRDASGASKVVNADRLNPADLDLLRTQNALDLDLYDYANQLMDVDLHFFTSSPLFRDPLLDDKRTFCDRRNRPKNATLDDRVGPNDDDPPDYAEEDYQGDDSSPAAPLFERRRRHR